MMIRILSLLLIAGGLFAWASEPINAPVQGASTSVTQPHVTAELIPEKTCIQGGQPFDVALHLHSDKGWHTYWINPGDAGLATTIRWTLPPGFTAGPIQWPTPEKHAMGPLMTYGYEGDVYLLTTITPPKSIPEGSNKIKLKAHAEWLVCQEECIPGQADLELPLDSGVLTLRLPVENTDFFAQARERLPVPNTRWEVKAYYGERADMNISPAPPAVNFFFREKDLSEGRYQAGVFPFPGPPGGGANDMAKVEFFPEQNNVLSTQTQGTIFPSWPNRTEFQFTISLVQNGDKPAQLSGIFVADMPLIGNAKAIYVSAFPVASEVAAAVPSGGSLPVASGNPDNTRTRGVAGPPNSSADGGHRPPLQTAPPLLIAVLGAAFVGGLILNLMPCVLPVLSLKVFSLMRHAGENPRGVWVQGAAFTAGVVISFWVLAGLLLALRAAGNQLGWGFQMQSPGFVLALIFLFFLLALNLFGVFELGTSLVGLDAKTTNHVGGLASSFLNGALATLAATPCTAPFMGGALGFAAQQPPFIALLIFTFLALGMATPYLLLTIFPGALRFVPKPGAWMEAFKQFMGFLLMATVIFLIYVFGALVGEDQTPWLLVTLLLAGLAVWIYGRWSAPTRTSPVRVVGFVVAMGLLAYAIYWSVTLAMTTDDHRLTTAATTEGGWQPWSSEAVDAELAKGRPVFVDFTAAWCLSCKVNERVALDTDVVKKAFADKNVALFRADWTRADSQISNTLRQYNRDGVPLYLLYSPKNKDVPQVLPEVLTPGIVLEALKNL